jgi:hypothetical protein
MTDMVTRENLSAQTISEILGAAFIDCNVLNDQELTVRGAYTYFLYITYGGTMIRFSCLIRTRSGVHRSTVSAWSEKVNNAMIVMRCTPIPDGSAVMFDWYQHVDGGVTPKNIVMTERVFDTLVKDALARDDMNVFA